jgi:hypothetical protein
MSARCSGPDACRPRGGLAQVLSDGRTKSASVHPGRRKDVRTSGGPCAVGVPLPVSCSSESSWWWESGGADSGLVVPLVTLVRLLTAPRA